jgi:phytoene dehydrogenase-like protein
MTTAPRITIAGGGLAGMTAALRLGQRGYPVTLYEQKTYLGGNLASRPSPGGVELDVYPHMFLSWYHNFWRMLEEAGVDRDESFASIDSVKQLRKGDYPRFTGLTDGYSPRYVVQNLFSGVGPPADMFVFWYSTIDLLAEKVNPTMLLEDVSVTGFMQARPYMTERAAKACDNFITMVWAVPSYLASADDYREYLAYSVSSYKPPCVLAKGSALDKVIAPLTAALVKADVDIQREVGVTSVSCTNGRVTEIGLERAGNTWTEQVEELVLAVPPHTLSQLVRTGDPGHRIVETVPKLAQLSRLRSQQIPILHVYFKRKLPQIPCEPVGLYESRLALAFTDISGTWPGLNAGTVLSVSASDPYALPGTGDQDDAFAILTELAEYLEFDPGLHWGASGEIDWTRTHYETNADSQLFINETGIDVWRPAAACDGIDNLSFAGNFCANRIGMMTVESAVASGLEAARAVVERRGIGAPVQITEPSAGTDALYVWLRYAYGPSAYLAKAWSMGTDWFRGLRRAVSPTKPPTR